MQQKPFIRLTAKRSLTALELPAELEQFYVLNEGVGLQCDPDRDIRICRFDEVIRIGWRDLHIFGAIDIPAWEQFAAYRIGISLFFDEIVYVLNAPSCSPGSILTIGVDVSGPGGTGPNALEPSLVLATTFADWLRRLELEGWIEYGLGPAGIDDLLRAKQRELRQYYRALNPGISWGDA